MLHIIFQKYCFLEYDVYHNARRLGGFLLYEKGTEKQAWLLFLRFSFDFPLAGAATKQSEVFYDRWMASKLEDFSNHFILLHFSAPIGLNFGSSVSLIEPFIAKLAAPEKNTSSHFRSGQKISFLNVLITFFFFCVWFGVNSALRILFFSTKNGAFG